MNKEFAEKLDSILKGRVENNWKYLKNKTLYSKIMN